MVAISLIDALAHVDELFELLRDRERGERSWTLTRAELEARGYDLKAVNPDRRHDVDLRTPEDILDAIEARGLEVAEALSALRASTRSTL